MSQRDEPAGSCDTATGRSYIVVMEIESELQTRFVRLATDAPDWDAVYARELPRVYNFFRYRLQNAQTAEDLTAVTLTQIIFEQEKKKSGFKNSLSSGTI